MEQNTMNNDKRRKEGDREKVLNLNKREAKAE